MLLRLAVDRALRPAQVAMAEVAVCAFACGGSKHRPRQRAERPLHQREVLDLIMGGEEQAARPQLGQYAPH